MEQTRLITVLIVEDEANVRKLFSVNLTSRGYAVVEAQTVSQALTHLHNITPDLMVLDIRLPDSTGWNLLARMLTDPAINFQFPVVVTTASVTEAQIDRTQYPQVVDVLIKPFSATRLMNVVERALRSTPQG
jgi:CheY-like chemotaxis protein